MNKDLIYFLKYLLHQSKFLNYKQIKYYNNLKNINSAIEGEIINKKISQFNNKITNKLLDYIALDNII